MVSVSSILTLQLKYNNMSREELKRMWFSMPHPTPKKEVRIIKVTTLGANHYECKKIRDDKYGYSAYSSNWRTLSEAIAFARKLQEDSPEYSIMLH